MNDIDSIIIKLSIKMANGFFVACKDSKNKLNNYLFPEEHTISVHHSTINIKTLFYIRLGSLIYLTAIYLWTLTLTKSLMFNIIYLTM